jgi:hypothetical protein
MQINLKSVEVGSIGLSRKNLVTSSIHSLENWREVKSNNTTYVEFFQR